MLKPPFGTVEYTVEVKAKGVRAVYVAVKGICKDATIGVIQNRIAAAYVKKYPTRPALCFARDGVGDRYDLVDSQGTVLDPTFKVATAMVRHDPYQPLAVVLRRNKTDGETRWSNNSRVPTLPRRLPRRSDDRSDKADGKQHRPQSDSRPRRSDDGQWVSVTDLIRDMTGHWHGATERLITRRSLKRLRQHVQLPCMTLVASTSHMGRRKTVDTPVVAVDALPAMVDTVASVLDETDPCALAARYKATDSYRALVAEHSEAQQKDNVVPTDDPDALPKAGGCINNATKAEATGAENGLTQDSKDNANNNAPSDHHNNQDEKEGHDERDNDFIDQDDDSPSDSDDPLSNTTTTSDDQEDDDSGASSDEPCASNQARMPNARSTRKGRWHARASEADVPLKRKRALEALYGGGQRGQGALNRKRKRHRAVANTAHWKHKKAQEDVRHECKRLWSQAVVDSDMDGGGDDCDLKRTRWRHSPHAPLGRDAMTPQQCCSNSGSARRQYDQLLSTPSPPLSPSPQPSPREDDDVGRTYCVTLDRVSHQRESDQEEEERDGHHRRRRASPDDIRGGITPEEQESSDTMAQSRSDHRQLPDGDETRSDQQPHTQDDPLGEFERQWDDRAAASIVEKARIAGPLRIWKTAGSVCRLMLAVSVSDEMPGMWEVVGGRTDPHRPPPAPREEWIDDATVKAIVARSVRSPSAAITAGASMSPISKDALTVADGGFFALCRLHLAEASDDDQVRASLTTRAKRLAVDAANTPRAAVCALLARQLLSD